MDIYISSPLTGTAIGLAEVPDPVFAGSMVGPGAAVDPERAPQVAVAPIAGRLVKLKPHAFVVQSADGRGVLVHLGIDTVNLEGRGFELIAVEGEQLRAGQPIVTWNPAEVEAGGLSPVSPVIALDAESAAIDAIVNGAVAAGDELFHWR
ncbi:PTS system, glucose subfamily, IIA subunit [Catenulispora acidiphila DSM 44928]|uniref:PTS system, glucose subfamily, IIA subunit n=1 Tax=Catenulispora acidiphila (strain DSM 44928 / JCM 14897 / NBRC 102108 / NRRL B-24433 / ID139908) TaxID=479433 RepID=C7QIN7_CATAD|nr:PTS glucose transporter subunit IIA [Catenulispora acidiphila]ACU76937.1 PTS system, glucose subfamily, IIA subunit [Catenulispora acidiphila DSM 44928]